MLKRVTGQDDIDTNVRLLLWQNLGEIYRSRMGKPKSAIECFDMAVKLDPTNEKLRLILAELHERSHDNPAGAIEQHKALIKQEPMRIESYKALWTAYMKSKQYDHAWCMAGALVFLQSADAQQAKYYQDYLGKNLKQVRTHLKPDHYKRLRHPEQDMALSRIMHILGQGGRAIYGMPIKQWGVHKKKDKLSLEEGLPFCKIYNYCANKMTISPIPDLYLDKRQNLGLRNATNIDKPTMIIGSDMVQTTKSDRELTFVVSKLLTAMRPEHYLASTHLATEHIKQLFVAAMYHATGNENLLKQLGQNREIVSQLDSDMPKAAMVELHKAIKRYLSTGNNPNLSRWRVHVDHTSSRVALLMSGDLQLAASCIKNQQNPIGKETVANRIRELVLFAISDEYFELRRDLGLSIES